MVCHKLYSKPASGKRLQQLTAIAAQLAHVPRPCLCGTGVSQAAGLACVPGAVQAAAAAHQVRACRQYLGEKEGEVKALWVWLCH